MTVPAPRPRRARAVRWAVVVAAVLGTGAIAWSATQDGMTYYRTPSEVAADARASRDVRLGGMVVPGSVAERDEAATFVLTDGAVDVRVRYAGSLPGTVREGEGAVVEGRVDDQGVLHATTVLLRHSNEYRAPEARS
ncbi:cytochrome c maturation protein CcmE [Cellulosimicrobium sp. NPDC057127]|uniref:cytochrome c maturation protein CcmE n=1 Tax=Cellulosimicrobium sp. NPDC057127 TaxID=3346026 RepID=UPI0036289BB1